MDPLISLKSVSMSYEDDLDAIIGIDLDIFEGEFVCVLGESGSGKSTLLKILAGFIHPTEGQALFRGSEIDGIDWNRGVVFQNPPLFEWLTVRQNIEFGPKMRGLKKAEYSLLSNDYLKKVGLEDAADMKIYDLSGGMKQRVSIARTLINNPSVLLMDEPFGALDAMTRENIQDLVRNIWVSTRKTIFFITHDVEEALLLGTRVIVIGNRPGRIIDDSGEHFASRIIEEKTTHIKYTDEFYQERERLLRLIHSSNSVFAEQ